MPNSNSEKTQSELDFEKDLRRLDEISERLSSSSTRIDTAMKLYEEGQKIIARLENAIVSAKKKINDLINEETALSEKIDEDTKSLENMTNSK